jgi:broad specificity phosphatase PhoE
MRAWVVEFGRHASLRGWWQQCHAGSSPVPGTISLLFGLVLVCSNALAWEKTIYISRHGETYANRERVNIGQKLDPRVVLDEKGIEQARKLADLLSDSGIQAIYVSEASRTHQTAEPLASKLKIVPKIRHNLNEMGFGHLEGLAADAPETRDNLRRIDSDCGYRFGSDGESRNDIQKRLKGLVEEIERPGSPKTVMLVGHFGTVRGLLSLFLNASCPNAARIVPANTDLYRLTVVDGKVKRLELSEERGSFKPINPVDLMKGRPPAGMLPVEGATSTAPKAP